MLQPADNRAALLPQFRRELAGVERLLDGTRSITFAPCPEPRHLFSQLDAGQQAYYLLFRKHFLAGKALRGDLGYVILLAQEIIHGTIETDDPVMSLFLLVYEHAPSFPVLQRHGSDWVLALNATLGARHNAGRLAATLTHRTKHIPHRDLILDGVLELVMGERSLTGVNLNLLLGLKREHLPLTEFTKDWNFVADVTRTAIASFFNTHTQAGLLPSQRTFTYWTAAREKGVMVEPFAGLLHDRPRGPMQVATCHAYSEATLPALREAVSDTHKYALYLARASEEPAARDATAIQVRADAHRPLRALIQERLPGDLQRHVIMFEQERAGAYSITFDDLDTHRGGSHRFTAHEGYAERYERAKAAHLKHLHETSDKAPAGRASAYHHYYATHTDILDLDKRQLREYLWWRTRWRAGEAPDASPAILNTYATEVINQWGFDSPQAAYDELVRFCSAYARSLVGRAGAWLVDFARVHEVSDTPNDAELRVYRDNSAYGNSTVAALAWLARKDYAQLDPKLILALSGFTAETGKFYQRTQQRELFDRALPLVIQTVSEHFLERRGVDVFDHFLPKEQWSDYHERYGRWSRLFNGATHDPSLKPQRILYTVDHHRLERLKRLLGNALKYTENTFRKREKIGGQRKVDNMNGWTKELREAIDALLEELLTPPKPKPQVRLDRERLAKLERDSAGIRERLIDPAVLAEAEREAQQPQVEAPAPSASDTPAAGTVAAGASDEYGELLAALGAGEKRVLTLAASGAGHSALEGVARELRTPLNLIIDRINERALDTIGDNLIDTYEDPPVIIDEHQEGLRRALEEGTP